MNKTYTVKSYYTDGSFAGLRLITTTSKKEAVKVFQGNGYSIPNPQENIWVASDKELQTVQSILRSYIASN